VSAESLALALKELYEELAGDIARAAPVCQVSGRCCRFQEYGHTLFLSWAEAQVLLSEGLPAGAPIDEVGCPFQSGRLCTAHERRPLGCRVFFCDPNYAGVGETLSEKYITRLKRLHESHAVPWDYRPLHQFLREADSASQTS
jgi:Fe-S-cluster containining protein